MKIYRTESAYVVAGSIVVVGSPWVVVDSLVAVDTALAGWGMLAVGMGNLVAGNMVVGTHWLVVGL